MSDALSLLDLHAFPVGLLLDVAIKGSLILLFGAAVAGLLRGASAASRHLAWTTAIAAIVVLPFCSEIVPQWTIELPIGQLQTASHEATGTSRQIERIADEPLANEVRSEPVAAEVARPLATSVPDRVSYETLFGLLWLLGTALMVLLWIAGITGRTLLSVRATKIEDADWLGRLNRGVAYLKIRRRVRLLRSHRAVMPMTWGVVYPVILLPHNADQWESERRDTVLFHELAHIRRFDGLTQAICHLATTVYWFNPLVWIAEQRFRIEQERASDDLVLGLGLKASDYASQLVSLARELTHSVKPTILALAMARNSQLETRIRAILNAAEARGIHQPKRVLIYVACAALLVVAFAAVRPIARQQAYELNAQALPSLAELPALPDLPELPDLPSLPELPDLPDLPPLPDIPDLPNLPPLPNPANSVGQYFGQLISGDVFYQGPVEGEWTARIRTDRYYLSLEVDLDRRHHESTIHLSDSDRTRIAAELSKVPIAFTIDREAGSFRFEGEGTAERASGSFVFTPDEGYVTALNQRGISADDLDLFVLASVDVKLAYVDELISLGYTSLDADELIAIRIHDAGPEYIRSLQAAGYTGIPVDELIAMRIHDIDAGYIEEMRALGLDLDFDEIVAFAIHDVTADRVQSLYDTFGNDLTNDEIVAAHIHDIDADYLKSMQDLGLDLDFDEIVAFSIHDVTPDRVDELKATFGDDLSNDEIVAAHIHDISADYLAEMQGLGLELDFDEIVGFAIHDVTAGRVRQMREMFGQDISGDEIVAAHIHDIDADYLKSMQDLGLDLDFDEIVAFSIHDVTPDRVGELKATFGDDLSNDEIVAAHIHDISADYLAEMQGLGLELDFDEIVGFAIHDVTADRVRQMRETFGQDISGDEIVAAQIHDIDAQYLAEMKAVGFEEIDFDEVVAMNIHGVSVSSIEELVALGFEDLTPEDAIALKIHDITAEDLRRLLEEDPELSIEEAIGRKVLGRR